LISASIETARPAACARISSFLNPTVAALRSRGAAAARPSGFTPRQPDTRPRLLSKALEVVEYPGAAGG
jgi:hypothetical protein